LLGKLAWYKGGAFFILGNEWTYFLLGHHLFLYLQLDHSAFQFNKKKDTINNTQENVFVVQIGRVGDQSPCNFNNQLKNDHLPPQINLLGIQQQNFC
jgi:hypothetical protein